MSSRLLTAREAGDVLQVNPQHVRELCAGGRLPGAEKRGRDWTVPEAAVTAYRDRPKRSPGGPRRAATTYRVLAVVLGVGSPVRGMLTTDHAASSYGLPVVVIAGTPHGTAEAAVVDRSPTSRTAREWAREAGYRILP